MLPWWTELNTMWARKRPTEAHVSRRLETARWLLVTRLIHGGREEKCSADTELKVTKDVDSAGATDQKEECPSTQLDEDDREDEVEMAQRTRPGITVTLVAGNHRGYAMDGSISL